jgi:uncharacterized protein (TIGR03032 family)
MQWYCGHAVYVFPERKMLNTIEVPDALLVSCPNGGGLVYLFGNKSLIISHESASGISLNNGELIWVCQSDDARKLKKVNDNELMIVELSSERLDLHDVLADDCNIYLAVTETNEVIRFDKEFNVLERWKLPGEPDSCHLNCIALHHGRLIASIFGRFDSYRGYKGQTRGAGQVIDVRSGEIIIDGLSQPHSLVIDNDLLYLCNSEEKELCIYDEYELVRRLALPGYTRGIAIGNNYLYIGLSLSRNIESDQNSLDRAAIAILSRSTMELAGFTQLPFTEIYDIRIVPDHINLFGIAGREWKAKIAKFEVDSRVVAGRDGYIDGLNQAITEREEHVTNLYRHIKLSS